jgi:ArsR family transcriptional regulator
MKQTGVLNQIDLMFRAFSDPTRLRILHILQHHETCVGDLVQILDALQPKVSRHLAYLRKAGLVEARKDGLWCHYSLAAAKNPFHQNILNCLKSCFCEVPEIKADRRRAEKIQKAGGCCPT